MYCCGLTYIHLSYKPFDIAIMAEPAALSSYPTGCHHYRRSRCRLADPFSQVPAHKLVPQECHTRAQDTAAGGASAAPEDRKGNCQSISTLLPTLKMDALCLGTPTCFLPPHICFEMARSTRRRQHRIPTDDDRLKMHSPNKSEQTHSLSASGLV